jgi:predicted enzyme related to lactoylglutathione lyase
MDRVVHFELPVKDMKRARRFYREMFGWDIVDVPFADTKDSYVLVHTGKTDKEGMIGEKGVINGALERGPAKVANIVVAVKNLDVSLKKARAKKCSVVVPKHEIPHVGFYAKIKDLEGNVVGMIQARRS